MIAQLNDIAHIWWQWMGSMFWQVSLLIILVTALDMVIRKWAWPQVRYALWALVFIKLIITPTWEMPTSIVSWIQPQVEEKITVQIGTSDEAVDGGEPISLKGEEKAVVEAASCKTWLLSGWLSGMFVFSLLLVRKMMQFKKWNRMQTKSNIPEWHNELMLKICKKLKLNKIPAVVFSKDVKSPAVYGVIKQYLILPEEYMDKLTKEQAEHVLIHELCHLKRGDLLVHWFCIALQIVYWFNPLLIWSRRQMRHVCEICCDLSVANVLREKTVAYRETLLRTARELFEENMEPSLGFLGIFEEPYRLVPRLRWLEKRSWENRKRRMTVTVFAMLFMIICVMPMAVSSQTSEYDHASMGVQQDQVATDSAQGLIEYELLIMEVDSEREIDFGELFGEDLIKKSSDILDTGILITESKSRLDIGELFKKMIKEPDVKVLSHPKIMTISGESAELKVSGYDSSAGELKIEFTPDIISSSKIKQVIDFKNSRSLKELTEGSDSEEQHIDSTFVSEGDEGTFFITAGEPEETHNDKNESSKRICVIVTWRVVHNPLTGDENSDPQYDSKSPHLVQMDYQDADILHLINFISELTGKIFIVGNDVKGKVTIHTPTKLTVDEAYEIFEDVLEVNGYKTVTSGKAIKIVKAVPDN